MSLSPKNVDHLVLTVKSVSDSENFYCDILGMKKKTFGEGRVAFHFGNQKINLHPTEKIIDPLVKHTSPGSSDLCLVFKNPIEEISEMLREKGVNILAGPSVRTGALGPVWSVYCYDADENLIELSSYQ